MDTHILMFIEKCTKSSVNAVNYVENKLTINSFRLLSFYWRMVNGVLVGNGVLLTIFEHESLKMVEYNKHYLLGFRSYFEKDVKV